MFKIISGYLIRSKLTYIVKYRKKNYVLFILCKEIGKLLHIFVGKHHIKKGKLYPLLLWEKKLVDELVAPKILRYLNAYADHKFTDIHLSEYTCFEWSQSELTFNCCIQDLQTPIWILNTNIMIQINTDLDLLLIPPDNGTKRKDTLPTRRLDLQIRWS